MLHIDLVGREDLSGAIYRQIREAISKGVLRAGERLPATRELARAVSVARSTVVIAYERLAADGVVVSVQGGGTFVSQWATATAPRTMPGREDVLVPRALWERVRLPTFHDVPAEFNFSSGLPDAGIFPHQRWRRLISKALRTAEVSRQNWYGAAAGTLPLRAAIARHIGVSRGIVATAQDIVITSGTQQAVDLLARVVLKPGDRVAVEDPGYEAPRRAFEAAGAEVVDVPVDGEGIVVEAIPGDVKAIYVTPSRQFPLTSTMSLRRRRALLELAEYHGAAIIEDDYDGEFRFAGRPLQALQTLDTARRVIYVGTFSKTMFPALRIGFVVLPPSLRAAVERAKFVSDWSSSILEQVALTQFIEEGSFSRHVRKARLVYRERHQKVVEVMARDFAGHLDPIPSTAGPHVAVMLRSGSIEELQAILARAAALDVRLHDMTRFPVGGKPRAGLVIGYGAIDTDRIEEGLKRLRSCFP